MVGTPQAKDQDFMCILSCKGKVEKERTERKRNSEGKRMAKGRGRTIGHHGVGTCLGYLVREQGQGGIEEAAVGLARSLLPSGVMKDGKEVMD